MSRPPCALTSSKISSVACLCGMPQGAAGPESGVEIPNLMTSAAADGPGFAATSATAAKSATRVRGTGCLMAIPSSWTDSESEISLLHALVAQKILSLALHHELPRLEHVAVLGQGQREHRVLLDQDDGDVERVDLPDDFSDLGRHDRREAHRRLVQQEEVGPAHEGAGEGQRLLIACDLLVGGLPAAVFTGRG